MPEHKHTPGPWTVHDTHGQRWIEPVASDDPVARFFKKAPQEFSANASLIAAAPELLEACIALINYDESAEDGDVSMLMAYAKATRLARAAIAKATGQA